MAGFYPDVPDNRMAYDVDGSRVLALRNNGVIAELSSGTVSAIQNEASSQADIGVTGDEGSRLMVAVVFPELRELKGVLYYERITDPIYCQGTRYIQTSSDTTNGVDGTWTTRHTYSTANNGHADVNLSSGSFTGPSRLVRELYRTQIINISISGVRGVRVGMLAVTFFPDRYRVAALHLYGSPSDTTDVDRLFFIETGSTNNVAPAFFDFGDVPRSSTATKTFRIRNASNSLTANSITLSRTVLFDGTPSASNDFQFSSDGTTWSNTLSIGNLAPGTNSGTLHIRRSTASNAELGVWALRLHADAISWS